MNEQNTIPPEMLEAAEKEVKAYILSRDFSSHITASDAAQFILDAAGVPALLARVAEIERELTEKIIRKLKAEYDKQANYPHEEGETWSYEAMSRYKAQLDLLFEMGHLAHDPGIISMLLYEDSQFLDRWLDSAEAKHHDAYSFLQSLGVVANTDRSRERRALNSPDGRE